jgi:hypothetical protein
MIIVMFGGKRGGLQAEEHHLKCEAWGWQHHVVAVLCCRKDWCTSQNRWHHEDGKLCGYMGKLLSVKNPSALQLLTQTVAPGTYYHTLFKRHLNMFVLPIHPLNGTRTQSMSQLSQGFKSFI